MTISSVNQIATALAVSQNIKIQKNLSAPKAAGSFVSGWLATGRPGAGATPPAYTAGSGYTCDKNAAGAIPLTNASVANYLARNGFSSTQSGTLFIVDRLWSCSGMGFASGTYAVTSPGALPARITDSGVGVEAYVEQFVAAGAASGTLTLNYLNTSGAAKAGVLSAVVSAPTVGQLQPIPLQSGDTGISQVVSAVTSATWTSGSFGITLLKRLIDVPLSIAGVAQIQDWAQAGLAKVPNDACLQLMWLATGTTAPVLIGSIDLIDG